MTAATAAAALRPTCNRCRRRPAAPDIKRCRPCLDMAASNSREGYARLVARAACTLRTTPRHARRVALLCLRPPAAEGVAAADPSRYIETVGGCEFGPTATRSEPTPTPSCAASNPASAKYAVYARTELEGAPGACPRLRQFPRAPVAWSRHA